LKFEDRVEVEILPGETVFEYHHDAFEVESVEEVALDEPVEVTWVLDGPAEAVSEAPVSAEPVEAALWELDAPWSSSEIGTNYAADVRLGLLNLAVPQYREHYQGKWYNKYASSFWLDPRDKLLNDPARRNLAALCWRRTDMRWVNTLKSRLGLSPSLSAVEVIEALKVTLADGMLNIPTIGCHVAMIPGKLDEALQAAREAWVELCGNRDVAEFCFWLQWDVLRSKGKEYVMTLSELAATTRRAYKFSGSFTSRMLYAWRKRAPAEVEAKIALLTCVGGNEVACSMFWMCDFLAGFYKGPKVREYLLNTLTARYSAYLREAGFYDGIQELVALWMDTRQPQTN